MAAVSTSVTGPAWVLLTETVGHPGCSKSASFPGTCWFRGTSQQEITAALLQSLAPYSTHQAPDLQAEQHPLQGLRFFLPAQVPPPRGHQLPWPLHPQETAPQGIRTHHSQKCICQDPETLPCLPGLLLPVAQAVDPCSVCFCLLFASLTEAENNKGTEQLNFRETNTGLAAGRPASS